MYKLTDIPGSSPIQQAEMRGIISHEASVLLRYVLREPILIHELLIPPDLRQQHPDTPEGHRAASAALLAILLGSDTSGQKSAFAMHVVALSTKPGFLSEGDLADLQKVILGKESTGDEHLPPHMD